MLHPRARTMLLLSTPALIIGIASSLVLIVVMKVASVLQQFLWERLPVSIGIAQDSPVWIIGMLTLTGIMVGLVIRYSHGHAGPDPACEPLIGMPVPTSALPGLLAALILGLAGGVSLGPEHPIMTVNIALAVALGSRMFPRIAKLDWTILASAGTIGALFGTPVAAALIFSHSLKRCALVGSPVCAVNGRRRGFANHQPVFSPPFFTAHRALHADALDRYPQRRGCCRNRYCCRNGSRLVSATFAPFNASIKTPGTDPRGRRFYPWNFGCYRRAAYLV